MRCVLASVREPVQVEIEHQNVLMIVRVHRGAQRLDHRRTETDRKVFQTNECRQRNGELLVALVEVHVELWPEERQKTVDPFGGAGRVRLMKNVLKEITIRQLIKQIDDLVDVQIQVCIELFAITVTAYQVGEIHDRNPDDEDRDRER